MNVSIEPWPRHVLDSSSKHCDDIEPCSASGFAHTAGQDPASALRLPKQPEVTQIKRSFQFSCFPEAMAFVDTVADRAWAANVDVSIYVHGEYVSLGLPGDGAGLTEAHFDFAQVIVELVC